MFNDLKNVIKRAFRLMYNPEQVFTKVKDMKFEDLLKEYLYFLIAAGVVAGLAGFLFFMGRAAYLDLFYLIEVNYFNVLNYASGRFVSVLFFYLFAGTILLFILALIVKPFAKEKKLTYVLSVLFHAVSPLLVFAWIPLTGYILSIWCIFLFVCGMKAGKKKVISKKSIDQRD